MHGARTLRRGQFFWEIPERHEQETSGGEWRAKIWIQLSGRIPSAEGGGAKRGHALSYSCPNRAGESYIEWSEIDYATSISFRCHNLSRTLTLFLCGVRHTIMISFVVALSIGKGNFLARIISEMQRVLEDMVQKTSKRAREINLEEFRFLISTFGPRVLKNLKGGSLGPFLGDR